MKELWTNFDWVIIAVTAFHAILFLQSGLDKLINFGGNKEWLTGHFSKSIFKNQVGLLLSLLTVLELAAGATSLVAMVLEMLGQESFLPHLSIMLCIKAYLALFLGQRIAQDYEGAASLAPYFLIALAAAIYLQFAL